VYTDALELIEKEIKKLTMKGELTAPELGNLKEAVNAACKIVDLIGELPGESSDPMTHSYSITPGYKYRYSGYIPTTHGMSMPSTSYRTGRHISKGDFYSGHSIHDRMVAKLEEMYDEAKTDHERHEVETAIRMIEQYK
jgi:hypothetical protein